MAKNYDQSARLTIAGAEVPISDYELDFAEGGIGCTLSCTLADPLQAAPARDQDVKFEIGVGPPGLVEFTTMMDVGRIVRFRSSTEFVNDVKSIAAVSRLAERVEISPPVPTVFFDPNVVDLAGALAGSEAELVNESHQFLVPTLISVPGMDLLQLLHRIYVERLGFSEVSTNITNFLIPRLDVGVQTPWHQALAGEIGMLEPKYHTDDSGRLWIIDPQAAIPAGMPIRQLGADRYAVASLDREQSKLVNAVILSYRDASAVGSEPTTILEGPFTVDSGTFGEDDWSRTETVRTISEFHDNPANPLEVTSSQVVKEVITTSAVADGLPRAVQIDSQTDIYIMAGRLKAGYVKETSVYCAVPGSGGTRTMRLVQTETNHIDWAGLPTVGEFLKVSETTDIVGSVIKIPDDPGDPGGPSTRTSVYDANKLDDDALNTTAPGVDVILLTGVPIRTEILTYRETGHDQVDVRVQRTSHLVDQAAPELNKTFQHTGTIRARVGAQQVTTNMLIVAPGTADKDRRPPARLAAGNLPFVPAKALALRILARRGNEPKRVEAQLAGVDLAARRGSLRKVLDLERGSEEHLIYVTGMHISGKSLGTKSASVQMSLRGVEVGPDV